MVRCCRNSSPTRLMYRRKVPWRLSAPRKMRQRKRLRAVDDVITAVMESGVKFRKLDEALQLPTEEEMLPKGVSITVPIAHVLTWPDKYTVFSIKGRGYRKGIHKIPKWTRVCYALCVTECRLTSTDHTAHQPEGFLNERRPHLYCIICIASAWSTSRKLPAIIRYTKPRDRQACRRPAELRRLGQATSFRTADTLDMAENRTWHSTRKRKLVRRCSRSIPADCSASHKGNGQTAAGMAGDGMDTHRSRASAQVSVASDTDEPRKPEGQGERRADEGDSAVCMAGRAARERHGVGETAKTGAVCVGAHRPRSARALDAVIGDEGGSGAYAADQAQGADASSAQLASLLPLTLSTHLVY